MLTSAEAGVTQAIPGPAPRRVTVVGDRWRMDVSLPVQSLIAELVPQLVRLAGAHAGRPAGPHQGQRSGVETGRQPVGPGWGLHRLGAPALPGGVTVAGAGVHDGEMLYLSPADAVPPPMVFDDVVDAIADAAASRGGVWRPEVSRRAGAAGAGLAFTVVAVLLAVAGPVLPVAPVAAAVLAVLLLVGGGAAARVHGDSLVGAALVGAGLASAGVAGLEGVRVAGTARVTAAALAVALAASAAYAVLAAIVVADRAAWFVPAAVASGLGGLAAAASAIFSVRPSATAAVLVGAVIAVNPALPWAALRLGRLPLPRIPTDVAAFRRDERPTLGSEVERATGIARDTLTGLLAAAAIAVLGAAVVLLRTGDRWAWYLVGVAGMVMVLRSRAYLGVGQRLALLFGGAVATAGAGIRLAGSAAGPGRLVLVGAFALTGLLSAVGAVHAKGRTASPYWSRLLDIVEITAMVGLLPLAAAVIQVYAAIRALGGRG